MSKQRVAVYARFSSREQSSSSIDDQLRICREIARREGWEILVEYKDEAMSGRDAESRPEFQRMMADAEKRPRLFDIVLVAKTDRFARNRFESQSRLKFLRLCGVRYAAGNLPIDVNPKSAAGALVLGTSELMDEQYSLRVGEDTLRGLIGIALLGYWPGGMAPYGYRKRYEPHPLGKTRKGEVIMLAKLDPESAEAAVMLRILEDWGLRRKSYRTIAKDLNAEGVLSSTKRGKGWDGTAIRAMLYNAAYTGRLEFNKRETVRRKPLKMVAKPRGEWVIVKRAHKALLPYRTLLAVERRKRRLRRAYADDRAAIQAPATKHLISGGVIRCAECGANVVVVAGSPTRGWARMGCSYHRRRGETICSNAALIHYGAAEEALLRIIDQYLLNPRSPFRARLVEQLRQRYREIAESRGDEFKRIDQELAAVHEKLERLVRAIRDDAMPPASIVSQIKADEARLAELEAERAAVEAFSLPLEPSDKDVEAALAEHKRVMQEGPRDAARENIRRQFESVKLLRDGRLEVIGAERSLTQGLDEKISLGVGSGGPLSTRARQVRVFLVELSGREPRIISALDGSEWQAA